MTWENKVNIGLPARHGFVWNTQEKNALWDRYNKGWTIEQLAEKHQRSNNAIRLALNGKEPDLIINGTNYSSILFNLSQIIRNKIELSSKLPYG